MKPMHQGFGKDDDFIEYGEMDQNNNLDGKGVLIHFGGDIYIGYYDDGPGATNLRIESNGAFHVAGYQLKDGKRCRTATVYNTDGTTKDYEGH